MQVWRNGRRSSLRSLWRNPYRFESDNLHDSAAMAFDSSPRIEVSVLVRDAFEFILYYHCPPKNIIHARAMQASFTSHKRRYHESFEKCYSIWNYDFLVIGWRTFLFIRQQSIQQYRARMEFMVVLFHRCSRDNLRRCCWNNKTLEH